MWSTLPSKLSLRTSSTSRQSIRQWARLIGTDASEQVEPNTHFRITLRRSAISLRANVKATLVALGIHRRMQTVYHTHSPDIAGKILRVKELVQVENVPASAVRTKTEQRQERKPTRGYQKVATRIGETDL
ncbi:uncharacterized protein B0H18DRAFT_995283 [Fomitopsis serialis]|uniref:uncharacterized protein n=1 Tax=Fomitopsis serialis TaxID=139415 RepID=UPI00200880B1|nr:uncharacterized protein B0H18DRAFT_995283 [Neoantrodia serialis]KAH9930121.1 hypothetical protein B0H18DRAFT_995283 [Neoantrodia serialis]